MCYMIYNVNSNGVLSGMIDSDNQRACIRWKQIIYFKSIVWMIFEKKTKKMHIQKC